MVMYYSEVQTVAGISSPSEDAERTLAVVIIDGVTVTVLGSDDEWVVQHCREQADHFRLEPDWPIERKVQTITGILSRYFISLPEPAASIEEVRRRTGL